MQKSLRILHVTPTLDPRGGGVGPIVLRLAAGQAMAGAQVHILTYRFPGAETRTQQEVADSRASSKVSIEWVPFDRPVEWLFTRRARQALLRLAPQFDVLWIHGVWDPICLTASKVARKHKIPYVVTPHGGLDPWTLSQRPWRKKIGLVLGFRSMLQQATFLHVGNADEKRLLAPLGLTTPTQIIPNGIFPEEFAHLPPAGSFIAQHPELTGRRYILFLGRLHYMKGLDFLADAFAVIAPQFPDLDLVVIGPDDGAKSGFERQIANAGLQSRVHMLGPLYGPERYASMVDALCFCLPSRREGFSMAILEALACGCPVVISQDCHFPEVESVHAGIIHSLSANNLAQALNKIAENYLRQEMGQMGRKLVLEHYTWQQVAEISLECCAKLGMPG